jgi:hypothetical protein
MYVTLPIKDSNFRVNISMDESYHIILLKCIIIFTIIVITEAREFRIQVLWDVTLCHWVSGSQVSNVCDPLQCWSD